MAGSNKQFNLSDIKVVLTVGAAVTDISTGMVIDGDFLKIEKENKEEVKTRKGTDGESYSVNSIEDNNRIINISYLPGSSAVVVLQGIRKNKTMFGITITSTTSPAFVLTSSKAVIVEEPGITVNGKDGVKDMEFKIRAMDSVLSFTG